MLQQRPISICSQKPALSRQTKGDGPLFDQPLSFESLWHSINCSGGRDFIRNIQIAHFQNAHSRKSNLYKPDLFPCDFICCGLAAYINHLLAVYERPQQFPWTSNWESWSHFLWPFVKVLLKLRLFYLNCQHCIILCLKNANILFCQAKQRFEKIAFFAWSIYLMGVQLHIHQCYYGLGFLCWAKILAIANVI